MHTLRFATFLLGSTAVAALFHCGGSVFRTDDPDAGSKASSTASSGTSSSSASTSGTDSTSATGTTGDAVTTGTFATTSTTGVAGTSGTGAGGASTVTGIMTSTTSTTGAGGAVTSGQGGATGGPGGATSGPGGAATGGSVGAGGASSGNVCSLPMVVGPCDAAFPAWWHNPATGVCEPFIYGGCGGNANRFDSVETCQRACRGGNPDMDACNVPTDCTLVGAKCCACEPTDARDFVAVNRNYSKAWYGNSACANVSCAGCPMVNEPGLTRQYFTATCTAGACTVIDIRKTEHTACMTSDECFLRNGIECCEGCDSTGIVALNKKVSISPLVCDANAGACPPCVPQIPAAYAAVCAESRCRVQYTR